MQVELPYTVDALFGGRVSLLQPARGHGYRVNVDAILLASFAAQARPHAEVAVDLGAGVGAVSLSLMRLASVDRLVLVERDEAVAALARRNLELNAVADRATVQVGDLWVPLPQQLPAIVGTADLVVTNPPYTPASRSGRARPVPSDCDADASAATAATAATDEGDAEAPGDATQEAAQARTGARTGELAPFLRAMADALGRRGKGCIIYPAQDLVALLTLARSYGLEPKRLRFVHGKVDRPARVVLAELAHARRGGLSVMPPLVETDESGRPTAEIAALLRPNAAGEAAPQGDENARKTE